MVFRSRVLQRCVVTSVVVAAISFSSLAQAAPLAIGTVEQIDSPTSSIVVLGQRFPVGSARLSAGSKSYPAIQGVRFLAPGALVWVDGELKKDGTAKVVSLTVLPEINVPGSTQVFVAGLVRSVDRAGKVKVGSLTIDTVPSIGTLNTPVKVGDTLEFLGVQPATNGLLIANVIAPLRVQGVGGTGVQGVGGTGIQGVGGTGVQGVGGTGVQGVGGTGIQGVGGTGIQGVGGTGIQGVGGTGVQGVGGTGVQGVGGTGVQGVGGTGAS